jgi:hypothetical protein
MIDQECALEIKPAINGYIVETNRYTRRENGMTDYKSEKTICNSWEDVVEFIKNNEF